MATAIPAMLPPALVVMLMQKWFVKGRVDTEKNGSITLNNVIKASYPGKGKQELRHPWGECRYCRPRIHRHRRPLGCGKSTLLRMVAGLEKSPVAKSPLAVNRGQPAGARPSATLPWCSRTMRCTRT